MLTLIRIYEHVQQRDVFHDGDATEVYITDQSLIGPPAPGAPPPYSVYPQAPPPQPAPGYYVPPQQNVR